MGTCKVVGSSKEDNFSHIPMLDPEGVTGRTRTISIFA